MYTILVNNLNELVTTVKNRIMQRSKLVDSLRFLVEPEYNGLDMSTFTVLLEYLTPVSHEYRTEVLVKSADLYKNYLEYTLPFDTQLTREAGDVQLQLTFAQLTIDPDGNNIQRVRKTSSTIIKILPITVWSDVIADNALTSIDQRLLQAEAMLQAANEMVDYLDIVKADNMSYNKETNTLQLTANGQPIGDSVEIETIGTSVISIEVDESGNMIVNYSDGRSENVGKIENCSCAGVYIPNYTADGMLTFTLKTEAEEQVYEFDIKDSNNWNPIDGVESSSDYIWEEL